MYTNEVKTMKLYAATIFACIFIEGCAGSLNRLAPVDNFIQNRTIEVPTSSLKYKIQSIPDSLSVYHCTTNTASDLDVLNHANRFGVSGTVISEGNNRLVLDGRKIYLENILTGFQTYANLNEEWGMNPAIPSVNISTGKNFIPINSNNIPSLASSIEIARDYVMNHNLSNGEVPMYYTSGTLYRSLSTQSGKTVLQREVIFKRTINGLPILGTGSQISVLVGNNGSIVGAKVDWPKLIKDSSYRIKSGDIAIADISSRLSILNKEMPENQQISKFVAKVIKLGYVGYLNKNGSRDIIPSYLVLGEGLVNTSTRSILLSLTAADSAPVRDHLTGISIQSPLYTPQATK